MTQRIGVLGNCDTGGIAYSLRAMLPGHEVIPFTLPAAAAERDAWLAELPAKADLILINNTVFKGSVRPFVESDLDRIRRYPTSIFRAFHPDCCYVRIRSTNLLISPAYNSAICVAGYLRGLSQEQVSAMYSGDMFEKLGYFDGWAASVTAMQAEFTDCGMDFRPYYLRVKRLGAFMHSINHPKIEAIVTLARFLALDLGAAKETLGMPVAVADGLAGLDWPLYPEIGEIYGVRGAYRWRLGAEVVDLATYVARSFSRYAELGLTAEDVSFGDTDFHQRFEAVLSERGLGNG